MGPDPPPTAGSRSSADDLKKEGQNATSPEPTGGGNRMLTTPAPPNPMLATPAQMLTRPAPPVDINMPAADNIKLTIRNQGDDSVDSREDKLGLAPGSATDANQRELKQKKKQPDGHGRASDEENGDIRNITQSNDQEEEENIAPGAVAVQMRSSHNDTISPDIENPPSQRPSTTLLQAEVALDIDAAIQRAVTNALRQRDEQMVAAAVIEAGEAPAAETTNEENIQEDAEAPKIGNFGNGEHRSSKKILYAGIGFVVLVIVIVVGVTFMGGGSDANPTDAVSGASSESPSNAGTAPSKILPSLAPISAPLASSAPSDKVVTPTVSHDGLECTKAIKLDRWGYQAFVPISALRASYVNEVCNVGAMDRGIWFLLDVPIEEETYIATLTVSNANVSAKISVYTGSSCEDLQCLFSDPPQALRFVVDTGVLYFVFVAGNGSDQTDSFEFEFEASALVSTSQPTRSPDPVGTPTKIPTESMRPTRSTTPPSTPLPTTLSPALQPIPSPTLPASPSGDCQAAPIITAGFSQAISTVPGLDTFINSECNLRDGDRGVWFKFVPTYEATVTLRVSEQNFGAKLAYFTGTCNFPVCGDVTTSGSASDRVLRFYTEIGKEYFLFVGGNGNNQVGTLKLTLDAPEPPPSSYCAGAIDVSNSLPYEHQYSTTLTVPTLSNEECRIDSDDRGTWFKYVPIEDAIVTVFVSNQEMNTRMAYFTGSSCASLTCGDFIPGSVTTRLLVFHGQPGKIYYILVASNGFQNVGNYRIQIIESLPPENSYFTGAADVINFYGNPFLKEDTTQFAVPSFSSNECSVKEVDRGLWYRYSPTFESITTVTVSGSFGKRLSMYTGNCVDGACDSLSCVKETGISVGSDRVLRFHATVGEYFFFLVSGSTFEEVGPFSIRFVSSEPPAHSYCSNAVVVSSMDESDDGAIVAGDTAAAVPTFSSGSCLVTDGDRGLWYKYTSASDRMVYLILSDHDWIARLSYYSGNCNSLTCGSHTGTSGADRIMTFHATSGVDYYFRVSGRDFDQAGPFQVAISAPLPPANSFCTGATEIVTVPLLGTTIGENSSNTVPAFSDPDCEITGEDRGTWFKLPSSSAAVGDVVTVQVTGQQFSAKVSVFESAGDSCSSLSCTISSSWSQIFSIDVTWEYTPGNSYYVFVSGKGLFEAGGFSVHFVQGYV
ncbi:MAG: hypothetical protein SGBAC_011627 [Bacillariaceae sp.]